jgi:hypothetical protein
MIYLVQTQNQDGEIKAVPLKINAEKTPFVEFIKRVVNVRKNEVQNVI